KVCAVCTCASISPGMAIWPEPSMVDLAATLRFAAVALPIQAILLPLIAIAPSRMTAFLPSIVTRSHPLSSRSTFCGGFMISALLERGVHFLHDREVAELVDVRQLVATRGPGGGIHWPHDCVAVEHQ